jgi:hypothetical protein
MVVMDGLVMVMVVVMVMMMRDHDHGSWINAYIVTLAVN